MTDSRISRARSLSVIIPILAMAASAHAEPTSTSATVSTDVSTSPVAIEASPIESSRRTYAAIAAAGGGALIATGLFVGKLASSKWDDAKKLCGDDLVCSDDADLATGTSLLHDAHVRANLATGLIAGGVAVLGSSLVLWLSAPQAPARRIGVGVSASPMGLSIAGGF